MLGNKIPVSFEVVFRPVFSFSPDDRDLVTGPVPGFSSINEVTPPIVGIHFPLLDFQP